MPAFARAATSFASARRNVATSLKKAVAHPSLPKVRLRRSTNRVLTLYTATRPATRHSACLPSRPCPSTSSLCDDPNIAAAVEAILFLPPYELRNPTLSTPLPTTPTSKRHRRAPEPVSLQTPSRHYRSTPETPITPTTLVPAIRVTPTASMRLTRNPSQPLFPPHHRHQHAVSPRPISPTSLHGIRYIVEPHPVIAVAKV